MAPPSQERCPLWAVGRRQPQLRAAVRGAAPAGVVGAMRRDQVLPAARWRLGPADPLALAADVGLHPPQRGAGQYRAIEVVPQTAELVPRSSDEDLPGERSRNGCC